MAKKLKTQAAAKAAQSKDEVVAHIKEIGDLMNVTESRVCQMHGAMIQKIRKRLAALGVPL